LDKVLASALTLLALFPPSIVKASTDKLKGRSHPMTKLTLVVDERELSTKEQVDALPEDLAEMIAAHGKPMTQIEIERLSLRLDEQTGGTGGSAVQEPPQATRLVEIERFPASAQCLA
jgi:hypothetical protein